MFICKESLGIIGVEIAGPGAFLDFCLRLDNGLAHLQRAQLSKFCFALPHVAANLMEVLATLSERCLAPVQECSMHLVKRLVDLSLAVGLECLNDFLRGWIDWMLMEVRSLQGYLGEE